MLLFTVDTLCNFNILCKKRSVGKTGLRWTRYQNTRPCESSRQLATNAYKADCNCGCLLIMSQAFVVGNWQPTLNCPTDVVIHDCCYDIYTCVGCGHSVHNSLLSNKCAMRICDTDPPDHYWQAASHKPGQPPRRPLQQPAASCRRRLPPVTAHRLPLACSQLIYNKNADHIYFYTLQMNA